MSVYRIISAVHLNGGSNLESKTLTTPKLKELQSPKVSVKQPLIRCYNPTKYHVIPSHGYGEIPSKH